VRTGAVMVIRFLFWQGVVVLLLLLFCSHLAEAADENANYDAPVEGIYRPAPSDCKSVKDLEASGTNNCHFVKSTINLESRLIVDYQGWFCNCVFKFFAGLGNLELGPQLEIQSHT